MATTKYASIRYEVLDRCLQKQSEENTQQKLRELCCDAIAEQDPKYEAAEISLRTFRSDISYIKSLAEKHNVYLQPIITQYFIDNKSEIWLLFLIAHSKR